MRYKPRQKVVYDSKGKLDPYKSSVTNTPKDGTIVIIQGIFGESNGLIYYFVKGYTIDNNGDPQVFSDRLLYPIDFADEVLEKIKEEIINGEVIEYFENTDPDLLMHQLRNRKL